MTVADWSDIRSAGAGNIASTPRLATGTGPPSSGRLGMGSGQLAGVAARGASSQAALPRSTQLTAGAIVVLAALAGALHDAAIGMLVGNHWIAAGAADAILTWPTGLVQVVLCLAGAALLLAGIVASGGMHNVDEVRGWVMLLGGGVAVLGLVPTVVVLAMYLVIAALFVVLCVLGGIAICLLFVGLLADL